MAFVGSETGPARSAGTRALLLVSGGVGVALAVLVGSLGYLESIPWGTKPGFDPPQGPNVYLPLVAVWAVAGVAALAAGVLCGRRPAIAAVFAFAAIAVGLAAPLVTVPAAEGSPPVLVTSLAWLVPVLPLALGLTTLLSHRGRGSQP